MRCRVFARDSSYRTENTFPAAQSGAVRQSRPEDRRSRCSRYLRGFPKTHFVVHSNARALSRASRDGGDEDEGQLAGRGRTTHSICVHGRTGHGGCEQVLRTVLAERWQIGSAGEHGRVQEWQGQTTQCTALRLGDGVRQKHVAARARGRRHQNHHPSGHRERRQARRLQRHSVTEVRRPERGTETAQRTRECSAFQIRVSRVVRRDLLKFRAAAGRAPGYAEGAGKLCFPGLRPSSKDLRGRRLRSGSLISRFTTFHRNRSASRDNGR